MTIHRTLSSAGFTVVFLVAACAPNLSTQARRYEYIKSQMDENARKTLSCDNLVFHFQHTDQRVTEVYDYYLVEGCSDKSDYVTNFSRVSDGDATWWQPRYGAVPNEDEYGTAAEQQLLKTARFDLSCDQGVELARLKAVIEPMRTAYRATIGARGCGKQSSYEVTCGHTGFKNGKHEVACTSVVSAPVARP